MGWWVCGLVRFKDWWGCGVCGLVGFEGPWVCGVCGVCGFVGFVGFVGLWGLWVLWGLWILIGPGVPNVITAANHPLINTIARMLYVGWWSLKVCGAAGFVNTIAKILLRFKILLLSSCMVAAEFVSL